MQNVHFSPTQLAPLFDVNVSTIKRWVDRGMLIATVTAGGHRRITRDSLAKFVQRYPQFGQDSYVLGNLLKQGASQSPEEFWTPYFSALKNNRPEEAEKIIDRLFLTNIPLVTILETVIGRTLTEIGLAWATGELSVYDEHRMCFLIRSHLFHLEGYLAPPSVKKPRTAILACVAGDQHELPLQMLGLLLRQNGWAVHILGINISRVELLRAAKKLKPQLIGISQTYHQKNSLDYLNAMATYSKNSKIRLAYGGQGWGVVVRNRSWPVRSGIRYFGRLSDFAREVR